MILVATVALVCDPPPANNPPGCPPSGLGNMFASNGYPCAPIGLLCEYPGVGDGVCGTGTLFCGDGGIPHQSVATDGGYWVDVH